MFTFPFVNELIFYVLAYIVPGILLGFGLFRGKKLLDRIALGIPLAVFLVTFVSYAMNIAGIPFGMTNVYVSLFVAYIFGIVSVILNKEEMFSSDFVGAGNSLSPVILSLFVVIISILSFYIRIQSISPIYYELDPYFYLYSSLQLITQGQVPLHDTTAWYPNHSSHRVTPLLSHFMALPYEFLFENPMDIYNLSYSAHFYPPFVFALMVLLVYTLFRNIYDDKVGVLAAMSLSFNELFLSKTMSGVFEAQPMGFMLLTYSLVMLYFAFKENKKSLFVLLGVSIAFAYLASNFGFITFGLFALLSLLYSFYLFFKADYDSLSKLNSFLFYSVLVILVLNLVNDIVYRGLSPFTTSTIKKIAIFVVPYLISVFLEFVLSHYKAFIDRYKVYVSSSLIFLLLVFFFSPLGSFMRAPVESAFSITQYNTALERTIAEQQQIGASIAPYVGSIGNENDFVLNSLFSSIFNSSFIILYSFLDFAGLNVAYVPKQPSIALSILTISLIVLFIRALYNFINKKPELSAIFFLIFLFIMGGMLKTKYGILLSYSFVLSVGIVIGEIIMLPYTLSALKSYYSSRVSKDKENKPKPLFSEDTKKSLSFVLFLLLFSLIAWSFFSSTAYSILAVSKYERFADNPSQFSDLLSSMCSFNSIYCSDVNTFTTKIENQFDQNLCIQSIALQVKKDYGEVPNNLGAGIQYRCLMLPRKWITSMEFINTTEPDSRITSWWDYGHWINYFGQRNAVIRNEHSYLNMILDVANAFIMGDEEDLKKVMNKYDSKYVLIDDEIILSPGTIFGSKFYALNYLACVHDNLTNVNIPQMNSKCEYDNLWETVYVSNEPCTISKITGKQGRLTYRLVHRKTFNGFKSDFEKAYCLGYTTLADGSNISALYYLNKTNEAGDLKLNKGFITKTNSEDVFVVLYTHDKIWLENGEIVDGWEDRKGRFYDSVVYKGFVLGRLDGFEKVFDNGQVKIYKLIS